MEKRVLGHSDLNISILTFGCWQAGGDSWTGTDDADSLAAMRAAYEAGINFFDTAEGYGGGHSEEIVGQFLSELKDAAVMVATKVGPGNLAAPKLRQSCDKSLQHLRRDKIDLYQIHWPAGVWNSPRIPIEETMGTLGELQKEGKIGTIGVSNFDGAQIDEAQQYGSVESLQPPYSLFFHPYAENGTIATCQKHGMGVIPYSPLAQGLVTGKFNLDNRPTDNRSHTPLFKDPTYGIALEAVEKLQPIAAKYGATAGQLALAWLIAQPGVTSPIVGARNAAQIQGMTQATTLKIEADDLTSISQIAQPVIESLPDQTNPWA